MHLVTRTSSTTALQDRMSVRSAVSIYRTIVDEVTQTITMITNPLTHTPPSPTLRPYGISNTTRPGPDGTVVWRAKLY